HAETHTDPNARRNQDGTIEAAGGRRRQDLHAVARHKILENCRLILPRLNLLLGHSFHFVAGGALFVVAGADREVAPAALADQPVCDGFGRGLGAGAASACDRENRDKEHARDWLPALLPLTPYPPPARGDG